MKVVEIVPLEPLVHGRAPVPSPDAISRFTPMAMPLPTAITGLIGSILGVRLEPSRVSIEALEDLEKLLRELRARGCRDPVIRGPIFRFPTCCEDLYIAVGASLLIPISRIKRAGNMFYVDLAGEGAPYVEVVGEERMGIKLVRGYGSSGESDKVAERGYMYSYATTVYRRAGGEAVTPVLIYALNCDIEDRRVVTRLGGEGRLANVSITSPETDYARVLEAVKTPLEELEKGTYITLTYSPLIEPANADHRPEIIDLDSLLGAEFVEEFVGLIPIVRTSRDLERIKRRKVAIKKRIERLGLGFSESFRVKRPQVLAIPPGTLIRARDPGRRGHLLKILWSIGFSSIVNTEALIRDKVINTK